MKPATPEPSKPAPGAATAAETGSVPPEVAGTLPAKRWLPDTADLEAAPKSVEPTTEGPGTAPAFLALPASTKHAPTPSGTAKVQRQRTQPGHRGQRSIHGVSGLLNLAAFAGLGALALGFADRRFGPDMWGTLWSFGSGEQTASVAAAPQRQSAPAAPMVAAAPAVPAVAPPPAPVTAAVPPPAPAGTTASSPASAAAVPSAAAEPPRTAATTPQPPEPAPGSPPPVTQAVMAPALMAQETAHVARFDALIAPVRDTLPSIDDATRLRDAMSSSLNLAQTKALRDQLKEPAARKLIDWHLMRGGNGTAREIKTFLDENPSWPNRDTLTQRSEEQLFVSGGSAREIKAFFDKGVPRTGIGLASLASAFLAEGDEAQATRLAAEAWRRTDIPATLETGFLDRFGRLLVEADHKARLDRYLIDNSRWTGDRAERATVARRILPYLSEPERKKADARLSAYQRLPAADALLAVLAAEAATAPAPDWGLAFQLAQWHRRAGRLDAAWKILTEVPTDATAPGSLDDWWEERRVSAYEALKASKADMAYGIVKSPGPLGPNAAKDQAFLAGWIALRHQNAPAVAERHFMSLEAAADGPQSRARAGYWLARTYEALNTRDKTRAALDRAARNIDTFYGQLARLELDPARTEIKITPPRTPTPEEAQRFNSNELVRAAVLSRKSNLDQSITRALLIRLSQTLDTEAEQGLLAHLAEALGDTQIAVRIGKSAVARGYNLLMYAYPIHAMPAYVSLRPSPEPALILGIARQESEFSMAITSGAGARGLMQVMPITAQHVCKDYRIKCEVDRLGRDPAYNAMMASAYIGDRMDEFTGSYVLTIAGYNAGPGRARQWMREFGDPRTATVNPVDWIHRIPFEETREYVQKVLSNMQIYRARLGQEKDALRLNDDLRRYALGAPKRAAANAALTPAPQGN